MRISRIATPDALYDDSVSADTFDAVGGTLINPIDSETIVDVSVGKAIGANSHHIY